MQTVSFREGIPYIECLGGKVYHTSCLWDFIFHFCSPQVSTKIPPGMLQSLDDVFQVPFLGTIKHRVLCHNRVNAVKGNGTRSTFVGGFVGSEKAWLFFVNLKTQVDQTIPN